MRSSHVRLGTPIIVALFVAAACTSAATPAPVVTPTASPSIAVTTSSPSTAPPTSASGSLPSTQPTQGGGQVAARWEGAGTVIWPRVEAHAVLLGDGRVIVVGDVGGKYEPVPEHSRFAELWDPATATWRETEYLNKARGQFAAVTLLDGRALVAGGLNASTESYSSAYVYDPATEHWTKVGLMGTARAHPAAAVLRDGRVLVAGGAYCTGFAAAGPTGAAALAAYHPDPDDRIVRLADAGPGPDCYALATAELFDPSSGTWSATGAMHYARNAGTAVTLADGRVLVAGTVDLDAGSNYDIRIISEFYDPATGRFSRPEEVPAAIDEAVFDQLGLPPRDRCEQAKPGSPGTLVALDDGDALLVGGRWLCWADVSARFIDITRAFRFTAATDHWVEVGITLVVADPSEDGLSTEQPEDLVEKWGVHPNGIVVPLRDGQILFAGGYRWDPVALDAMGIRTAELFDPATGDWSSLPDMPGARVSAEAMVLTDGSVLIVGGYTNPSDGYPIALGDAFRFVPSQ